MEVLTPKTTRRSTRLRVEMPVSVISLDRKRPFADSCIVLVVSAQGCGFRSPQALQLETPILLSGLPGGGSVTARVANCLPLGKDGRSFLIGASLYTHGNVWGIVDPPEDWDSVEEKNRAVEGAFAPGSAPKLAANKLAVDKLAVNKLAVNKLAVNKKVWPYNLPAAGHTNHTRRK